MNNLDRIIEDGNQRIDFITQIACLKLDAINKDYKVIEVIVEVEKASACPECQIRGSLLRQMGAAQSAQMGCLSLMGQSQGGGIFSGLIGCGARSLAGGQGL